jgi:SpoVK/Ycf46/Vps4 family AAA+-type ATPase
VSTRRDVRFYDIWGESGRSPWSSRGHDLGDVSGSVLLYGPTGCGKTMLVESFFALSGRPCVQANTPEILAYPDTAIPRLFDRTRRLRGSGVLIEDIDAILETIRARPWMHRVLLDHLRHSDDRIVFTTSRRPEALRDDEVDAFKYVIPVLYPDESLRYAYLESHADEVTLAAGVDFASIARATNWWSVRELQDLLGGAEADGDGLVSPPP